MKSIFRLTLFIFLPAILTISIPSKSTAVYTYGTVTYEV